MRVRHGPGDYRPYTPHKHQKPVHFPEGDPRVQVVRAGRRGGKTEIARREAEVMLGIEGTHTWIGAPNYKLTDRVFQTVYRDVVIEKLFGEKSVVKKSNSESRRYIEMKWGSWIECVSAERPESAKGEGLDLFIDDECAEHKETFYTNYVDPGLVDRQGKAIFISTPVGQNWFETYWNRGQDPEFREMGWDSHHWTSMDNPHLDQDWLARKKREVASYIWKQEYLAEFVAPAGMIWEEYTDEYFDGPNRGHLFNPDIHKVSPQWVHRRAIDIGFHHPTGCLWYAVDPTGDVWIYKEYLEDGVMHRDHAQAIRAQTEYPVVETMMSWDAVQNRGTSSRSGVADLTVKQIYEEEGIYAQSAIRSIEVGVSGVAAYLRATREDKPAHPRVFISDRCRATRAGMQRYRVDPNKEKFKPVARNDEMACCVRYALASRPEFMPVWMEEDPFDRMVDRYGYQGTRFAQQARPGTGGYEGIPGIGTQPRYG